MPRQSWKMSHGIIVIFSKIICVCQLTFSNSKAEAGLENVTGKACFRQKSSVYNV